MRLFEEMEEQKRLVRELGDFFEENREPVGLQELGWDGDADLFRGRRLA